MTIDINDYFGVSVSHGQKKGPKQYVAEGTIFRRDTQETVHEVYGTGTTMGSADKDAIAKAKTHVAYIGKPDDWKTRQV